MNKDDIKLIQLENGSFDISIDNLGLVEMQNNSISFALHNLLCYSRAESQTIKQQENRQGDLSSVLNGREMFSKAWLYYLEQNTTIENLRGIIEEFNNSMIRDYTQGLCDNLIKITNIQIVDKNKIQIILNTGSNQQIIVI